MSFESPQALILIILIIPSLLYKRGGGSSRGTAYAALPEKGIAPTWKQRFISFPFYLLVLALLFLILALARPRLGLQTFREVSKGVAINMVIDRSSSMGTPVKADGSENRLDAVKKAFIDFVRGDGATLEGRKNDLVGLISFGRYPETLAPLTLSHKTLIDFTETIGLIENKEEDGTSIGDALALAAARLEESQSRIGDDYSIESRIIILLTDGQNNGGDLSPLDAAALAADWGVRIYTIGFGAGYYRNAFGMVKKIPPGYGVDEDTLEKMAEITGGKYYSVSSADSLTAIYKEIDSLEKSQFENIEFSRYRELYYPFALISLLLILISFILSSIFLRRIP